MKRVLIIGATSGIGRRLAEMYAEKGWKTGITGRRAHLLDTLKTAYPDNIETSCFDVTVPVSRDHIMEIVNRLGGLDLLIISAGGGEADNELDWTLEKRTVETNVNGFIQAANWGFNYFKAQRQGHLVTISSIAGIRGNRHAPSYSASKAFQSNYFEALAIKARKENLGIHITCIEPGFIGSNPSEPRKLFWVVPLDKCAQQIMSAIEKKKRRAFISKRWRIVAWLLKWIPFWLYKRIL
jgi:short-subunit dehydrogenase